MLAGVGDNRAPRPDYKFTGNSCSRNTPETRRS